MRGYVGLILFAACTQSRFPCFLLVRGLGHFFRHRPLLPIGWKTVQILRRRRRKMTNTAPTTLSAIQAASQSTFYQCTIILDLWLAGMTDLSIYVIKSPIQLVRQGTGPTDCLKEILTSKCIFSLYFFLVQRPNFFLAECQYFRKEEILEHGLHCATHTQNIFGHITAFPF